MHVTKTRGLLPSQRRELWERWKTGQSLSDIARALEKPPGSIHTYLSAKGGIAPAERTRSVMTLSADEREEVSRGLSAGESIRAIARALGRAPSTVSREVGRNGGRVRYRANDADSRAWQLSRRPKLCKLARLGRLRRIVADKLRRRWSPEQVAGWLRSAYGDDESMRISHETIYRCLYIQARGVLKRELLGHLRSKRLMRRARTSTTAGQRRGRIVDAVSIRERPPAVEDRAIPGHWEGDLITGTGNTHIATLVERKSRFTMLVKLEGKDAHTVATALTKRIRTLPLLLRKSLTWDRGSEMAQHRQFTIATGVSVYFCDPQSPWQRGTNENTNRLLRQYFPSGTDLSQHSQAALDRVSRELNDRPRKTLGFETPAFELNQVLR
jgi:IS30 family transposase